MSRSFWRLLRGALALMLVLSSMPAAAFADIRQMPDPWISTETNPGDIELYSSVWREGWGNDPLPRFTLQIPRPDEDQPAIIGGYYYVNRPFSAPETISIDYWDDCYWAPISNADSWNLQIDVVAEATYPGPLFDTAFFHSVIPSRAIEGPFVTYVQYVARDTTDAARGAFAYGLDVTPPEKVTGLKVIPGPGAAVVNGWLTQSRGILKWDDKQYDGYSGTGYFEAFIDGKPYPVSATDSTSRRVYDLKEHYPGYGFTINTKREMSIEDLPAGQHTLQVRAVDRATNPGPLSEPVTILVDPDLPDVEITTPETDGQKLGALPVLEADVTDAGSVAGVAFRVDGAQVGATLTAPPYKVSPNLSALLDGSTHTVRVTAVDGAGRSNFAQKTFVIDKKPTATFVSPSAPGDAYSRLVPLKVAFNDRTGVTDVRFTVNGSPAGTAIPSASIATSGVAALLRYLPVGTHAIAATVSNGVGGSTVITSTIRVDDTLRPDLVKFALNEDQDPITWYDTAYPPFAPIQYDGEGQPLQVLYRIDRSPMTAVVPGDPDTFDSSYRVSEGTTYIEGLIDQNGVYLSNPAGLTGLSQAPGMASQPIEGIWYQHAMVRPDTKTITSAYGIDLTAPDVVDGLAAYSSAGAGAPTTGWLQQTRAVLRWSGVERDALSGTDHFNVYVDGERLGTESERIVFEPGRNSMSLTVEDFTPGKHVVTVTAVDKAGNESAPSAPLTVKIFSTPEVQITSPANDAQLLPSPAPLRALVTDAAGIANVTYSVDGVQIGVFSPPTVEATRFPTPTVYQPLASGIHTLTVTANSVSGPSATAVRVFSVDASLPPEVQPPPSETESGTPELTTTFAWFNTLYPTFSAKPSDVPTDPTEMLYLVDRSSVTDIDPLLPNLYYSFFSPEAGSTYFNGLIDQNGVYLSNPGAFDGAIQMPGRVSTPHEGVWYIHALIRNADGASSPVAHTGYGIDLTKPLAVTGVKTYASVEATTPTTGWMDQSRAIIRWDGYERDVLSGVEYYVVDIDNGHQRIGEDRSIQFQRNRPVMSLTIEDLSQGSHVIKVYAVDRAGNWSAASSPSYVNIDSQAPGVTLHTPTSVGGKLGVKPTVSCTVTDTVSLNVVKYYVDGEWVGQKSFADGTKQSKADVTVDLSAFSSGAHTLSATVWDDAGHATSTSRAFVLDKTAPSMSITSKGPNPFYPRKRDGYKDNYIVKFTTNEACTAYLDVYYAGKLYRTVKKTVNSGSNSIAWDGKSNSGALKATSYTVKLRLVDSAANSRVSAGMGATIRFYEVVRTSTGSARVIER